MNMKAPYKAVYTGVNRKKKIVTNCLLIVNKAFMHAFKEKT